MVINPDSPVKRIQENLLAANERRLLNWLVARLPLAVTPDKLTAIGFIGAAGVGAGYALSAYDPRWLWLSIVSFLINWFGDSLDGSLARFRKIERPNFGYFIDHSTDALGNMLIMLGIGLSPYVELEIALIGLVSYLLLSIHTFLSAKVTGQFNLTFLGGGPTEMRVILITLTVAMIVLGPAPLRGFAFSPFDVFIVGFAAVLTGIFLFETGKLARTLRLIGK